MSDGRLQTSGPQASGIRVRRYGKSGRWVALLHGGPGAPGHMAALAQDLSGEFQVLEPLQRGSGGEPLTVAIHVADTLEAIRAVEGSVALVGSSWGAMLALAVAAEHPEAVSGVGLVGCGTFDPDSRREYRLRLAERATPRYREILERKAAGQDVPLEESAAASFEVFTVDPVVDDLPSLEVDAKANRETWADALSLQEEGVHPQAFTRVACPVVMLHGEDDPHPGPMIRDSLLPFIPHLEYVEWKRCGHYPWIEREHREPFLARLRAWLHALR